MTTTALLLVVASALLHALWNAGLRQERDKDRGVVIAIAIGSMLAAAVALVTAVWHGTPFPADATGRDPHQAMRAVAWTLAAGAFEAVYFWTLARALALGPLGPVYTISRGGAVLLVWPVSIAVWGEAVTIWSVVGSVLLLAGLAASGAERGASKTAIVWASVCAGFIGAYHLAYKAALAAHGEPSAVFAISLGAASLINIVRLGPTGRQVAWQLLGARPARLVAIGCICATAFLLFMQALAAGGAGAIVTLRNTSVVFATLFAALIGDRPSWRQTTGAGLVAVGAVVLSLAAG